MPTLSLMKNIFAHFALVASRSVTSSGTLFVTTRNLVAPFGQPGMSHTAGSTASVANFLAVIVTPAETIAIVTGWATIRAFRAVGLVALDEMAFPTGSPYATAPIDRFGVAQVGILFYHHRSVLQFGQ